jgi:Xaa-Pro aminopeptidase
LADEGEVLNRVIAAAGGAAARVGISQRSTLLPPAHVAQLVDTLKTEPVDATDIIAAVRAIKSPSELQEMTAAAELSKSLVDLVSGNAARSWHDDQSEASLFAAAEQAAKAAGARQTHFLTSDRGYLRPPNPAQRVSKTGQLISIEFSNSSGYWVEAGTTWISEPAQKTQEALAMCEESLATVQALLRPGVEARSVFDAFRKITSNSHWLPGIWLGHGIGLDISEMPSLIPSSHERLEAGMTIAVHPHVVQGDGGVGAYAARTMVVEEGGARILGYPGASAR